MGRRGPAGGKKKTRGREKKSCLKEGGPLPVQAGPGTGGEGQDKCSSLEKGGTTTRKTGKGKKKLCQIKGKTRKMSSPQETKSEDFLGGNLPLVQTKQIVWTCTGEKKSQGGNQRADADGPGRKDGGGGGGEGEMGEKALLHGKRARRAPSTKKGKARI